MKKVMMFMLLFVVFSIPVLCQLVDDPLEPIGALEGFNWWPIVGSVLAILSGVLGKIVVDSKRKIGQVVKLGMETVEALDAGVDLADYTVKAAEDNVFTDVEKTTMKQKALTFKNEKADVKAQWKIIWAKKVS